MTKHPIKPGSVVYRPEGDRLYLVIKVTDSWRKEPKIQVIPDGTLPPNPKRKRHPKVISRPYERYFRASLFAVADPESDRFVVWQVMRR